MDYSRLLKFNLNDEVWVMRDNKPTKSTIETIKISSGFLSNIIVSYRLFSSNNWYNDKDLFKTKQELIEYIFNV